MQSNPGCGFTLAFSGSLTTARPHFEDFAASPNVTVQVSDLGHVSFSFPMGDGRCNVQGAIGNGEFSGTWSFAPLPGSSDFSDSGQGSFFLS